MYSCYLEPEGLVPGLARRSPWRRGRGRSSCRRAPPGCAQNYLEKMTFHSPKTDWILYFFTALFHLSRLHALVSSTVHLLNYTSRHQISLQCSALCLFIPFSAFLFCTALFSSTQTFCRLHNSTSLSHTPFLNSIHFPCFFLCPLLSSALHFSFPSSTSSSCSPLLSLTLHFPLPHTTYLAIPHYFSQSQTQLLSSSCHFYFSCHFSISHFASLSCTPLPYS